MRIWLLLRLFEFRKEDGTKVAVAASTCKVDDVCNKADEMKKNAKAIVTRKAAS